MNEPAAPPETPKSPILKLKIPGVDPAPPAPSPNAKPAAAALEPAKQDPNPLATKPADGAPPPAPEATPQPNADGIPTDIHERQEVKKTPAQYAQERRDKKLAEAKKELGVDDLQAQLDAAKAATAQYEIEKQRIEIEKRDAMKRAEELEALAKARTDELEQVRGSYFDSFKAAVAPDEDEEFATHARSYRSAFALNLPDRIPEADDTERRIFPEQLMDNPALAQGFDNIMSHYVAARHNQNAAGMDLAVNAVGQLLGIPMKIDPVLEKCEGLLPANDPTFRKIESAMQAAAPHFMSKSQRLKILSEEAPRIVGEQITNRTREIAANIKTAVILPRDVYEQRLQADPTDSAAVIAALVDDNPELSQFIDQTIATMAPAFARMGKIQMPTLGSNTPQEIEKHRSEARGYQQRLASAMPAAVLGHIAGPIIASLMGELRAAQQRLGAMAQNQNPGSLEQGGSGNPPKPTIPTAI